MRTRARALQRLPKLARGVPHCRAAAERRRALALLDMTSAPLIHTIGHGSRTLDAFLALLKGARIEAVIDVRAYPLSRRHPHFSRHALQAALVQAGIGYDWHGKALGGLRTSRAQSPHTALKHAAFRAFADHMASVLFGETCAALVLRANTQRLALMCAERDPAQCHRSFIADFLLTRGASVTHLLDGGTRPHHLPPSARVCEDRIVYDLDGGNENLLL